MSRNPFRMLRLETRCEMLKLVRAPSFVLPTFGFPVLFYVLFGLLLVDSMGGAQSSAYLLVSYAAFGIIGVHLFALGVGVASDRGMGWMRLKRASPMPPWSHLLARILVAVAFGTVLVLFLFALAAVFGDVRLPARTWFGIGLWLMVGGVPFSALGLALGHVLGPKSAPATLNLIYLPMSFASGLWLPIDFLPDWMQSMAQGLPSYHLGAQGHALLGAGVSHSPPISLSIVVLVACTAIFSALAAAAWHREGAG
ncbi:MAG: ABC transporter permease [Acidobacteriota bacterium]